MSKQIAQLIRTLSSQFRAQSFPEAFAPCLQPAQTMKIFQLSARVIPSLIFFLLSKRCLLNITGNQ